MAGSLPFSGFLDALRDKGYPISVHDHLAVGKLLHAWDQTSPDQLRDALAALVGRDAEAIEEIRAFFDQVYGPPPAPPVPPEPVRQRVRAERWAPRVAALAGLVAVILFVFAIKVLYQRASVTSGGPATPPPPAAVQEVPGAPVAIPPPTAPEPPPAPARISRRIAGAFAAGAFLVGLVWSWGNKARIDTRRWLRRAWRAALGALPGPYDYTLATQGLKIRMPHADVEDAATILARIYAGELVSRELDVTASLRLTLSGGLPRIVFKPVQIARPILVLQDIGADMLRWRPKVDAFLLDLRRQGITLERWYFDADIRRVSERPHGSPHPIDMLIERRTDAPLLVLSTGAGLAALAAVGDDAWRRAIGGIVRRSWLTPIADRRLWPPELDGLPLNVWPMTRRGLTQAARDLSGHGDFAPRPTRDVVVTREDVMRMRQLASLVPQESPEVLELLRQQFAPDVPDAVHEWMIRDARQRQSDPAADTAERADLLRALRREAPRLEADARGRIIAWLRASEPPIGSAAHLRWQKDLALQELALAGLTGGDLERPLAALSELAGGPLWEEVRESLLLLPPVEGVSDRLRSVTGPPGGRGTPPPDNGQLSGWLRRPRSWPGVREAVHAAAALIVVVSVAWGFGWIPSQVLAHVQGAFDLTLASGAAAGAPALSIRAASAEFPRTVRLLQDGHAYGTVITLPADGRAAVPLADADMGHYYQAYAALQAGNLALSQAVWVPQPGAVVVLIDALPWARITIEGTGLAAETTPVRVPLRPGTYRVSFENGGVTPPMTATLIVTPDAKPLRVVMPGFKAEDAAVDVTRPRR